MMSTAKAYFKAMGAFEAAERRHQAAIDELAAAIEAHEADKVLKLRQAVRESEQRLEAAWTIAIEAHRRYWQGRAGVMVPQLRQAAHLMSLYNRLVRASGSRQLDAAREVVNETLADSSLFGHPPEIIDSDAVPIEPPDSELLGDAMGVWKSPHYH